MHEYLMHYIGSGLYGMKRFVNESKKIGVQRAMRYTMIKNLSWGDPILCAEYKKVTDKQLVVSSEKKVTVANQTVMQPLPLYANIDVKTATIFGYFRIDSISYSDLPKQVKQRLIENLDVTEIINYEEPEQETRSCGEYSIGGCCYISNSIADMFSKLEKACNDCGYNVSDFKYFVKGNFVPFEHPIIIYNKNFHRGYSRISLDNLELSHSKPKKAMYFLYDYSRRLYLKKSDRDQLDRIMNDEFQESVKPMVVGNKH